MDVSHTQAAILRVLRRSSDPLSGRQIADIVGLAPNTAIKQLNSLRGMGLVSAARSGRATRWTTTADVGLVDGTNGAAPIRVALVVTAVDLEFAAVRQRLVNAERVRAGGMWFVCGEIVGQNVSWTVYLAQAGMGNATAAALVAVAAGELKANVVAIVGTAGGLKPQDHRQGDVIVASRIHNPYVGKQVAGTSTSELLGRDKTYPVPARLLQLAMAAIADSGWSPAKTGPAYNAKQPHAFIAPIVAVEAVQTDPAGPVIDEIRSRFQDAAALDMESHGLAAGSDIHDLPVLVVRGISDFLGDKANPGNDDLQPAAAANAAALLTHMLAFAHPDDFTRVPGSPAPTAPTDPPAAADQRDRLEAKLPGGPKVWLRRLQRRSRERARAALDAIAEMRATGTTAATWLNKAVHRPPAWLREDDTGDGWVLMGSLAALAGSSVSWRAFDLAADAAALTGDRGAQAYFKLNAALHRIRDTEDETDQLDDDGRAHALADLDAFPNELLEAAGPLVAFYRAAIRVQLPEMKKAAEASIAWLGVTDESGVLQKVPPPADTHSFDDELRDIVMSSLLQQVARMMLTPGAADDFGVSTGLAARRGRGNPVLRDLADDALLLAQWALRLRPESEGARLVEAQTMLGVLIGLTGRPRADVDHEVSRSAKQVEASALDIRDTFRDWHASSGSALATAARARSMQGDEFGALRMLLPAPEGIATQAEARHPEVRRLAAFFASATGQAELALNLVSRNIDPIEAEFIKASVYGSRSGTSREATDALFHALQLSKGRLPQQFQALMALVRRYEQLTAEQRALVDKRIDDTEALDAELADVLRARVALAAGDAARALELVRALPPSELVLIARTDVLVELGRAEDAARALFNEGVARHDAQLLLAALDLALQHDLRALVREIAHSVLSGEYSEGTRLRGLNALRHVERVDENWSRVTSLTEQLVADCEANGIPVSQSEQWTLIEALYFEGKFSRALEVLTAAESLSFDKREKAVLFFSVLKRAQDEGRASDRNTAVVDLGGKKLFARFMEAAREWAHDEYLAAFALTISMLSPDAELSEAQVMETREFAAQYFDTHGSQASIQQIAVEDDLEELVEVLSKSDLRNQKLEEIAQMVRTNAVPLGVLTAAAGRSYAESLIRVDMGYVIAVEDDGGMGVKAAMAALNGRVVVDTSSLVVALLTGFPLRKLLAKFDSVVLPDPLRTDLERARSSLALKSTGTLGWDPRRKQPFLNEIPESEAEGYARAADELWGYVQLLRRGEMRYAGSTEDWASAVNFARANQLPLWADDVVLRQVARNSGVAAFGSLDLITAYADNSDVEAAAAALRAHRVVDLPIVQPWYVLADEADWDPNSPFAAAIARPYAWRNTEEAFSQFRMMVRLRRSPMEPGVIGSWTHVAATGLALATPASVRHRAVSALLAWVLFNSDLAFSPENFARRAFSSTAAPEGSADLARVLFEVAQDLCLRHYPNADPIKPIVEILSDVLREVVEPPTVSSIMADFSALLGQPFGPLVFAAYLRSAEM